MTSIQKLRRDVRTLEEAADIMEVRRVLGLATSQDVSAARQKVERAQRALEAASGQVRSPEHSN